MGERVIMARFASGDARVNRVDYPRMLCVLAIAGVDRSRNKLPFSSEGPCYWEGVKLFPIIQKETRY